MKLKAKICLSWLALEVAMLPLAIPAFATFKDKVAFEIPQKVIVMKDVQSAGEQSFIVASNAPFAVISRDAVIEMNVSIQTSGRTQSGLAFGGKSQLPGATQACNLPSTHAASRIYTAQTKTAAKRGTPLDQAVKVTISYDPEFTPRFTILPVTVSTQSGALLAFPCDTAKS